jgi:hypothetical protein
MPRPNKYLPGPADPVSPRLELPREVGAALDEAAKALALTLHSYCRVALTLVSRGDPVGPESIRAEVERIRAAAPPPDTPRARPRPRKSRKTAEGA